MLIKCPECNKEISDKADKCIHCGYPIRNMPYIQEDINNTNYDVSFVKDNSISKIEKIKMVMEIANCDIKTAKTVVDKYCPTQMSQPSSLIKCPRCGSTNIQIVPRKWSVLTGFMTNKTDRVCVNCNKKF